MQTTDFTTTTTTTTTAADATADTTTTTTSCYQLYTEYLQLYRMYLKCFDRLQERIFPSKQRKQLTVTRPEISNFLG
jgi:hypothetical protein